MIIQIRGTSGSGKSTVMRKVMEHFTLQPVHRPPRKKPLYYKDDNHHLVVVGHYESPCGGGDTIGSARQVAELIQELVLWKHVLAEGLLLSEDVKWTEKMRDVRVVFLHVGVEQCLANIRKRRAATGNEKELNEKNTRGRVPTIERARVKLIAAGIPCYRLTSAQAVKQIVKWIKSDAIPSQDNTSPF